MTTSREFRYYGALAIAFAEAVLLILLANGYTGLRGFALGFGGSMAVIVPLLLIGELRANQTESRK